MFKTVLVLLALNPLISCAPTGHSPAPVVEQLSPAQQMFVGSWVEVLPGSDGDRYTFVADGTVVNRLGNGQVLRSWRLVEGQLVLGVVQENAVVIRQTYTVERITSEGMGIVPVGEEWGRVFRAD